MQCPKCQFENREGVKFCEECGANFDLSCPNCLAKIPLGRKFCGECGFKLTEPSQAPAIDYSQPQSYTPKFLSDKILTSRSSLEGERKMVTVFFADVANYTSLAEKLDPEEVHLIMDGCFEILMDEIHHYEGTINQFTGDGVMALFGAPVAHEDHAQRACRAALVIQKAINEYGAKISRDCGVEFNMRIGLNSGPVIVGAIGDDLRMDYTAVGDTTNVAMRMESAATPGSILVSENTHRLVNAYFDFEDCGPMVIKGKEAPQNVYRLIKSSDVQTRFEASVSRGLVKFVGRLNSIAAVKLAWEKVCNGSGQVLGIVGEAGVGKSRLLLEFRHSLIKDDITYFEGRCLQYGSSMPYLPFLEILRFFFGIDEGQREYIVKKNIKNNLAKLDKDFPSDYLAIFQDLFALKIEDKSWHDLEPKLRRERTFEALRYLFIRSSEKNPLMIAVEDLHWLDKTSEEFINYFVDSMAQCRILLVLVNRPEYSHPWSNKTYYSKIGLTQLTTESSAELVSAILEGGEVAPELKQLILDRSAGNPLFMEEFTHTLLENGSIERRYNRFVLSRKIDDIQVPDTIQGIIAARMDRLEENLKRTMQVASVIGRDFAFRILKTITGMQKELRSYLLNLQGLELIYEKSLFPELEYIFKHALTQEVAYNSLLIKRRNEIHGKIGQAIEQIYGDRLQEFYEILAYHYCRSGNFNKAYQYAKLAADKAEGNYSHWEAYGSYKNARDLLHKLPETEENKKRKIEVLRLIITPLVFLGFPAESLSMLQEGEMLSKELGDDYHLARFYSAIGTHYANRGNPQLGIKYTESALEKGRTNQDIELMGSISTNLFFSYESSGEYYKIVDVAQDVIDLIEKAGRKTDFFSYFANPYSTVCSLCGSGMGLLGNFEEGKVMLDKGLRTASEINHLLTLGLVELHYSIFFWGRGEWEAAKAHFQKCIKYGEESKFAILSGLSWSGLGYVFSMLGDSKVGKRHAEKGLEIYLDSGMEQLLSWIYYFLGSIYHDLGDLKSAQSHTEEALRLSQKNGVKLAEGMLWMLFGRILVNTEPLQIDRAEECILKGMEILLELKIKAFYSQGYLILGELYLDVGQQEKAKNSLKRAESMFQEMGTDYWLVRTMEVMERL
jgi:class 3 adenylate cyclase/tetratricopeptide (TPR) repeat protein